MMSTKCLCQNKVLLLVSIVIACILLLDKIEVSLADQVKCMENGKFYRDPDRPVHTAWTNEECAKYFLCLEGEVFDFRCSNGLLFDVSRQICDFEANVDNCDISTEPQIPKPLKEKAKCPQSNQMGCADGTCLPKHYFCDGSMDCPDGSDEGDCDLENDIFSSMPCNKSSCVLPDCFCSVDGTGIPGHFSPSTIPQMITLTFDDAIDDENWDIYTKQLFNTQYKNPNGCPIRATFFVSHQNNNYYYTQKLWNQGHEIAIHSVTHRSPEVWWTYNATLEDWFDEMVGQANILHKFSKIRMADIRGLRVPHLSVGWNRQFLMMKEFGFVYDSSVIAPFSNPPIWPYSLEHKIPHECTGSKQLCPTRSYKGLWELPMNPLEVGQVTCIMLDSCHLQLNDDIYEILMHNFRRHYLTNRAPLGLYFHSSWFRNTNNVAAFQRFIDNILKRPDVWFVTNTQALEWIKNPTPTDRLHTFKPWNCQKRMRKSEKACKTPNTCKLYSRVFQEDRYLQTCTECPAKYPWIRNEFGLD